MQRGKKHTARDYWILYLSLAILFGCATSNGREIKAEQGGAEEKRLAKLDLQKVVPRSLVFSRDGQHATWLNRTDNKYQLLLDGKPGPTFDEIDSRSVALNSDGHRVAYIVENKTTRHVSVVIDDTAGPEFDKILSGSLLFSPDGSRVAYAGSIQEKYQVILDGASGLEYELVGHLVFSPDSRHFAYAVQKDKRRFIVLDGQAGPPFDDVFPAGFSPDSRYLAYYATQDKKQRIVVNGHLGPEYAAIGPVVFHIGQTGQPDYMVYGALRGNDLLQVLQPLP